MRNVEICRQILVTFPGFLISMNSGMGHCWIAANMRHFQSADYAKPYTNEQCTFLALILHVGRILGTCVNVFVLRKMGCKFPLIIACSLLLISNVITWAKRAFVPVLFARFLYGTGISIFDCFDTIYMGEVAHTKIRAIIFSVLLAAYSVGATLQYAMAYYISYDLSSLVSVITCLITLLTTYYLIESPHYWVASDRPAKALKTINWLYKLEPKQAEKELQNIRDMEHHTSIRKFFAHFAKRQVYSSYAISLTLSFVGTVVISIYSSFANFLVPDTLYVNAYHFAMFININSVLMSALSVFCVDRFGRRSLIMIGFSVGIFSNSIIALLYYVEEKTHFRIHYFSWLIFGVIFFYLSVYTLSANSTIATIRSEMFPASHKNCGISLCSVVNSLANLVVISILMQVAIKYGNYLIFLILCVSCVIGFVFVSLCLPETKGKTLAQIQEMLTTSGKP